MSFSLQAEGSRVSFSAYSSRASSAKEIGAFRNSKNDGLDQHRVLCLFAETLRMVPDSIVTSVCLRDDDRYHLPLRPGKVRTREHDGFVKVEVALQRTGVKAVDGQNIGHVAVGILHAAVLFREVPRCLRWRNRLDPGHFFLLQEPWCFS